MLVLFLCYLGFACLEPCMPFSPYVSNMATMAVIKERLQTFLIVFQKHNTYAYLQSSLTIPPFSHKSLYTETSKKEGEREREVKSIGYSRPNILQRIQLWGADLQEQTAVNLLYMKTPLSCTDITLSGTKSLQLS